MSVKTRDMKRNETDLIKCSKKRILTAKCYKFKWQCIDIIAKNKGLNRYSKELKPLKEKFSLILDDLIFDKKMSIEDIKDLIKSRTTLNE